MDTCFIQRLRIFLLGVLTLLVLGGSAAHLAPDATRWAERDGGAYLLVDGSQGEDPHVNG